ncbi:signal peptide peptidase SppA [uncultured Clostridium sp.]|uniref:signal peptide peptidase SppA n=1 Tax=uncultured Clostridium sp. TaxID=59620 RepID=UPI0025F32B27|nr:signal peptide peptidase SppA [uncultured Clostridium sp.]
MNKKQIIGLIVAAVAFICISGASVLINSYSKSIIGKESEKSFTETALATADDVSIPSEDFIGVVKVDGVIQSTSGSNSIFNSDEGYNHTKTLKYIDEMTASNDNKGILLYVNSPGGGVYESDELYLKLKEYKEITGRPVWTYMASQACSGGYYISMASDKIYANRNCWTGSIGVITSLTNMKGLYDKLGIQEIDITSGPNKAMGSAGIEMTDEHRAILQSLVDEAYDQFTGIVSEGRGMDIQTVKTIADGRIYSAKQALDLGLIDNIDTYENMQSDMLQSIGSDAVIYTPEAKENVFASLFSKIEGLKTKSDAQIISEYLEKQDNGGLMYYAKQ